MPEMPRFPSARIVPALVVAALTSAGSAASASELDWSQVADVGVIEIITNDEDGDLRETKVWFVLLDGVPHLRTSDTRWRANTQRDPGVLLRIEGVEYVQLARDVSSPEMIERVDQAIRAKYGWRDAFFQVFATSDPDILRLAPPD